MAVPKELVKMPKLLRVVLPLPMAVPAAVGEVRTLVEALQRGLRALHPFVGGLP